MYQATTTTQQRSAFSDGDVSTASPRKILVKCFDRLDVDLAQALTAIDDKDPETANRVLGHAQDLLGELAGMVDTGAWQHADALLSVYDYVLRLLAVGNFHKASAPILESRRLLAEIGDAFREASQSIDRGAVADALAAAPAPTDGSQADPARPAGVSNGFSAIA